MTKAASRQGGCFLFKRDAVRIRIPAKDGLRKQQRATLQAGTGGVKPV